MLVDNITVQFLQETIKRVGWLEIPSYGNSMFPFINEGEICRFIPYVSTKLKKGDVLLVHSLSGQLIAHRLYKVRETKDNQFFLLKGDSNLGFDEPISEDRIIGKLTSVKKKHATVSNDNWIAFSWGRLILTFPILSEMLRNHINRNLQL